MCDCESYDLNCSIELEAPELVPEVGDTVGYFSYGTPGGEYPVGVVRAAIVTKVGTAGNPDSPVSLAVLNPTGLHFNQDVERGDSPGCWNWLSACTTNVQA